MVGGALSSVRGAGGLGGLSSHVSNTNSFQMPYMDYFQGIACPCTTVGILGFEEWDLLHYDTFAGNMIPPFRPSPSHQLNEAFLDGVLRENKLAAAAGEKMGQETMADSVAPTGIFGGVTSSTAGGPQGGGETNAGGPLGDAGATSSFITGVGAASTVISEVTTGSPVGASQSSPRRLDVHSSQQAVAAANAAATAAAAAAEYQLNFCRGKLPGRPTKNANIGNNLKKLGINVSSSNNNNNNASNWGVGEGGSQNNSQSEMPADSQAEPSIMLDASQANPTTVAGGGGGAHGGGVVYAPGGLPVTIEGHDLTSVLPPTTKSLLMTVPSEEERDVFACSTGPQRALKESKYKRNYLVRTYPLKWLRKIQSAGPLTDEVLRNALQGAREDNIEVDASVAFSGLSMLNEHVMLLTRGGGGGMMSSSSVMNSPGAASSQRTSPGFGSVEHFHLVGNNTGNFRLSMDVGESGTVTPGGGGGGGWNTNNTTMTTTIHAGGGAGPTSPDHTSASVRTPAGQATATGAGTNNNVSLTMGNASPVFLTAVSEETVGRRSSSSSPPPPHGGPDGSGTESSGGATTLHSPTAMNFQPRRLSRGVAAAGMASGEGSSEFLKDSFGSRPVATLHSPHRRSAPNSAGPGSRVHQEGTNPTFVLDNEAAPHHRVLRRHSNSNNNNNDNDTSDADQQHQTRIPNRLQRRASMMPMLPAHAKDHDDDEVSEKNSGRHHTFATHPSMHIASSAGSYGGGATAAGVSGSGNAIAAGERTSSAWQRVSTPGPGIVPGDGSKDTPPRGVVTFPASTRAGRAGSAEDRHDLSGGGDSTTIGVQDGGPHSTSPPPPVLNHHQSFSNLLPNSSSVPNATATLMLPGHLLSNPGSLNTTMGMNLTVNSTLGTTTGPGSALNVNMGTSNGSNSNPNATSASVYDQLRQVPAEVLEQRRDQLMLAYMAQRLDKVRPHGRAKHEFIEDVKRVWIRRAGEAQVVAETRAAALAAVNPFSPENKRQERHHPGIAKMTSIMNQELQKGEAGERVEVNLNLLTVPTESRSAQEANLRLSARERLKEQLKELQRQRQEEATERRRREERNPNPKDKRYWLPLISAKQPTHPIRITLPSTLREDEAAKHQLKQLQQLVGSNNNSTSQQNTSGSNAGGGGVGSVAGTTNTTSPSGTASGTTSRGASKAPTTSVDIAGNGN